MSGDELIDSEHCSVTGREKVEGSDGVKSVPCDLCGSADESALESPGGTKLYLCADCSDEYQSHPNRVSRKNHGRQVNVQRQITRQGKVEYAASYQRAGEYEDGTEYTGVALSLFIKDEPTTRMLYECLREFFEGDDL